MTKVDFVISSVTTKLALIAASLCDLDFMRNTCCNVRFLFNSCTFHCFCSAVGCSYFFWWFSSCDIEDYPATSVPQLRHMSWPSMSVNVCFISHQIWKVLFSASTFLLATEHCHVKMTSWKISKAAVVVHYGTSRFCIINASQQTIREWNEATPNMLCCGYNSDLWMLC